MALKKQMELFEDGGLKDEGNTIDPVSGNDVPPGSTQEEVRDDIPAQLSEGEFVFPADVVRYIGLEKLMQMRQQAKMGLQTMDDMGQMGNSEEAVMPDDIPFELSDLDMEDDPVEMATGGLTGPASGIAGFVPSQVPATSFVQAPPPVTTMPIPPTPAPTPAPAPVAPTYTPATQQAVPTFTPEQMQDVSYPGVIQTPESAPQSVEIINPTTGERRTITYIPGVTQLPEGFILASEYTAPDAQATSVTPVVGQSQVREDTTSERRKEEAMRAEMAVIQTRKDMIDELFGENYRKGRAAKPFSDLFGKQEPGTVTTGGYIVGDNGELLNPVTGEQEFFGKDGVLIPLGFKDKPKLDTSKEGGVNMRFTQAINNRRSTSVANRLRTEKSEKDPSKSKAQVQAGNARKQALKATDAVNKAKKELENAGPRERKEKEKNFRAKVETKQIADKYAKQSQDIASGKADRYYGGRAKGGLMEKEVKQPKKMRRGGLASK